MFLWTEEGALFSNRFSNDIFLYSTKAVEQPTVTTNLELPSRLLVLQSATVIQRQNSGLAGEREGPRQ